MSRKERLRTAVRASNAASGAKLPRLWAGRARSRHAPRQIQIKSTQINHGDEYYTFRTLKCYVKIITAKTVYIFYSRDEEDWVLSLIQKVAKKFFDRTDHALD
ncbi:hypothetical protein ACJJTC_000629 [Scirpophaga incertulas]